MAGGGCLPREPRVALSGHLSGLCQLRFFDFGWCFCPADREPRLQTTDFPLALRIGSGDHPIQSAGTESHRPPSGKFGLKLYQLLRGCLSWCSGAIKKALLVPANTTWVKYVVRSRARPSWGSPGMAGLALSGKSRSLADTTFCIHTLQVSFDL